MCRTSAVEQMSDAEFVCKIRDSLSVSVTLHCGGTSSQNCTFFQSTGADSGCCTAKICPCNDNICQLRSVRWVRTINDMCTSPSVQEDFDLVTHQYTFLISSIWYYNIRFPYTIQKYSLLLNKAAWFTNPPKSVINFLQVVIHICT